jgi:hypothetical protein
MSHVAQPRGLQGTVAHLGRETTHIVGVFEADQWVVAEGRLLHGCEVLTASTFDRPARLLHTE